MDIVSHGLWARWLSGGRVARAFWLALRNRPAPDLFSFGILWGRRAGLSPQPVSAMDTVESTIPPYVHHLYNVTHSFVALFLVVRPALVLSKNRSGSSAPGVCTCWSTFHPFLCLLPDAVSLAAF